LEKILDAHVQIPPGVPGSISQTVKVGGVAPLDTDTAGTELNKKNTNFSFSVPAHRFFREDVPIWTKGHHPRTSSIDAFNVVPYLDS